MAKQNPNTFEGIWQEDFNDLKKISKTAFILRQIYRLYRDYPNYTCSLSEYHIQKITGWNRQTIRAAKYKLMILGEITKRGSFTFMVKPFRSVRDKKIGQKSSYQQDKNRPTLGQKSSSFNLPSYTDNTNIKEGSLNDFVCKDCQNYEAGHLDAKGDKAGYCSILLIALPPYANASGCEHKKPIPAESEAKV